MGPRRRGVREHSQTPGGRTPRGSRSHRNPRNKFGTFAGAEAAGTRCGCSVLQAGAPQQRTIRACRSEMPSLRKVNDTPIVWVPRGGVRGFAPGCIAILITLLLGTYNKLKASIED